MRKGIAMVTLVVIISVMLILVSVITVSGVNASNTSRKIAFASEIKMLQDSINTYKTNNNNEYPISDFIVIDLTTASDDVKKQFLDNEEDIVDNKVSLRKIDYTKLHIASLSKGISESEGDIYVVSDKSGFVYYAKGVKIGNSTYYTLTDELKSLLKFNNNSTEVLANDAIICEMSAKDWTNENVDVSIKVPKEYTNVTVSIDESILNIDNTILDDNYNIYNVKVLKNSQIGIDYTNKESLNKKANFSITNIDKTPPDTNIKNIYKANVNKNYLEVNSLDLQSGIKIIKYDIDKIEDTEIGKNYFNSNGIEVKDKIIELDTYIPYITLYIEDNAGNYKILLINI